jgi:hypothetical protein
MSSWRLVLSPPVSKPLPSQRILELASPMLTDLLGRTWAMESGPLLRCQGSTIGVRVAAPHTDSVRHLDLEILLNVDDPAGTSLVDCSTGLAEDPEEAIRQALTAWIDTTAAAALEMVEQRGRLATHLSPGAPDGFPGWFAIVGGVTGWSVDGTSDKQQWFVDTSPWAALASVITPALDREYLNGVRIFVGQGGEYRNCEVRINGRVDETASAALAGLDWPRSQQMSVARTFLLLVHPAEIETSPPTA